MMTLCNNSILCLTDRLRGEFTHGLWCPSQYIYIYITFLLDYTIILWSHHCVFREFWWLISQFEDVLYIITLTHWKIFQGYQVKVRMFSSRWLVIIRHYNFLSPHKYFYDHDILIRQRNWYAYLVNQEETLTRDGRISMHQDRIPKVVFCMNTFRPCSVYLFVWLHVCHLLPRRFLL